MKNTILCSTFFVLIIGFKLAIAKNENLNLAEIFFEKENNLHHFILKENINSKKYMLLILKNNKSIKDIHISENNAQKIINQSTQILWDVNFRSTEKNATNTCHIYARIIKFDDKAVICLENKQATGSTFGLLNFMFQL